MPAFFGQLLDQAIKAWRSLGVPQRVTLVVFAVGLVSMLTLVGVFSAQPNFVPLTGGLSPSETATASAKLRDAQIPFRYEAGRGVISVPAAKADDARMLLIDLGLTSGKGGGEGFDLLDRNAFGATEFVQKVNYIRALQGSLERKLQALECIEEAHVTLSIPEHEVFLRDRQEAKASVEVKARRGREIRAPQIAAIRHLVSSAVPKLKPNNVAVMDAEGRLLARFQNGDDALSVAGDQLESRINTERYLTVKVESLLDHALGVGRAAVQVSVQMDFARVERSSKKMDPESGVLLDETMKKGDSQGAASDVGGVPGVRSNAPGDNGAAGSTSAPAVSVRTEKTVTNRYHYDTLTETVRPEVGEIKRLSVAVMIKPRMEGVGSAAKPLPLTDAELVQLSEVVKNAVGFTAARQDEVKVQNAPASSPSDLAFMPPLAEGAAPLLAAESLSAYLPALGTFAGVVLLVFVFWKTMQRLTSRESAASAEYSSYNEMLPLNNVQKEIQTMVNKNSAQAAETLRTLLK